MPLHLTKIAFGARSMDDLRQRLESRPDAFASTRNLPRRKDEIAGGSLYWILAHTLIGRSPIRGFVQNEDRRWNILLEPRLIAVHPMPRRAHQGWRYLAGEDAPPDLVTGAKDGAAIPGELLTELNRLGLV